MVEHSCCVTGHRILPEDSIAFVTEELTREVRQAIADGYYFFITGFAEGVDMLFARIVLEEKKVYPKLFLEAVLPFVGREDQLDEEGRQLLARCTGVYHVKEKYERDCFFARNRDMVTRSSRVIAVYDGRSSGGTLFTMDYAKTMERNLRVIDLSQL